MKRKIIAIISIILVCIMAFNMVSCSLVEETILDDDATETPDENTKSDNETNTGTEKNDEIIVNTLKALNLMEKIQANNVMGKEIDDKFVALETAYGIELFKSLVKESDGENMLISPLSVQLALAMTANGAKGETKAQIENIISNGISIEELNDYLYTYVNNLPSNEKNKLEIANSIWFRNGFDVKDTFLQTNADYYGADIYQSPFDESTVDDINNWVKENTDQMIPQIIDKISSGAVMYLINAIAFDSKWADPYYDGDTHEDLFITEDKTERTVDFMYGHEDKYIEDENSKGFIKYYEDNKYAFVALLPDEEISISDYVASLTGERIASMIENSTDEVVFTSIPKFESEYSVSMKDILKEMGITDMFDEGTADFSKTSDSDMYVESVTHKTYISVDEKGTKAAAVTVIEDVCETAGIKIDLPKEVYLKRPFVYMIIDCETNIPFFIGTMMDVAQ